MENWKPTLEDADILAKVSRYIREHPDDFRTGAALLEEEYSEKARREYLERLVAESLRDTVNEIDLWPRVRMDSAISSFRARLLADPQWLLSMSCDEAEAVCLLGWLAYDSRADQFEPQLCEFQQLPWDSWESYGGHPWQGRDLAATFGVTELWMEIFRSAVLKLAAGYLEMPLTAPPSGTRSTSAHPTMDDLEEHSSDETGDNLPMGAERTLRTLGDAAEYWATTQSFMTIIGRPGMASIRAGLKRLLPPPEGRRRGSEGWWKVHVLIAKAEMVLPDEEVQASPLAARDLRADTRRLLRPPDFNPAAPAG